MEISKRKRFGNWRNGGAHYVVLWQQLSCSHSTPAPNTYTHHSLPYFLRFYTITILRIDKTQNTLTKVFFFSK